MFIIYVIILKINVNIKIIPFLSLKNKQYKVLLFNKKT